MVFNFLKKSQEQMLEDARRLAKAKEDIKWCEEIDKQREEEFNRIPRFSLIDLICL